MAQARSGSVNEHIKDDLDLPVTRIALINPLKCNEYDGTVGAEGPADWVAKSV